MIFLMGRWQYPACLLLALLACILAETGRAQRLDNEEAIDTIVGSEVSTEEKGARNVAHRLRTALSATRENIEQVRKAFSLEELEIVLLSDVENEMPELARLIGENEADIEALRDAIEGSAIFFHAMNSRSLMVRDVLALDFPPEGAVTIFVRAADG